MIEHKFLGIPVPIILAFFILAAFVLLSYKYIRHERGNGPTTVCGNENDYKIRMQEKKEKDFAVYQEIDGPDFTLSLSISEAALLNDRTSFEESIQANRSDRYGEAYQKYNYVVCEQDGVETIWVAKWNVDTIQGISECPGPKFELKNLGNQKDKMINIFPEDKDAKSVSLRGQQTPCWLDGLDPEEKKLKSKVEVGLLDAISKHYMLAQGEGTTIKNFKPEWSKTQVRYAGEIIVDVEKCEYWLNNGSGTYLPTGGDELQEMAQLFSDTLGGTRPAFVIDVTDRTTSHGGIPDTVDNSTSQILPSCANAQ